MKQVRVGLIGCGNTSAAYLRAAAFFPDFAAVACADLDPSRAQARADEFGLPAVAIDAMLADPITRDVAFQVRREVTRSDAV